MLLSLSPPPPVGPDREGGGPLRIGTKNLSSAHFLLQILVNSGIRYFHLYGEGERHLRIGTKNLSSAHFLLQIVY